MTPTHNNPGASHENGAIETAHGSLKRRLSQALKVRGSAYFAGVAAYQQFIDRVVGRLNRRVATRAWPGTGRAATVAGRGLCRLHGTGRQGHAFGHH